MYAYIVILFRMIYFMTQDHIFSSPELKAQVSYYHHNLSGVHSSVNFFL